MSLIYLAVKNVGFCNFHSRNVNVLAFKPHWRKFLKEIFSRYPRIFQKTPKLPVETLRRAKYFGYFQVMCTIVSEETAFPIFFFFYNKC